MMRPFAFSQITSSLTLSISMLIAIQSKAQINQPLVQISAFIQEADSLLVNQFSRADSAEVQQRFAGNFDSLRLRRILFYLPSARRSITWERLEQYLLLEVDTIRSIAHNWGFHDSVKYAPYYFLQYLRLQHLQPPFKQAFFTRIKQKAFEMYPDPRIESFNFFTLLNYNFIQQREKNPRFKPKHR